MKKVLISAAGANMAGVLACSEPTFRQYAEKYGYDLLINRELNDGKEYASQETRKSRWAKIDCVKSALATHDVVVWMDADAMITNFERDILEDLPADCFQALALELFPHRFNPQTGVWILRKDEMTTDFLAEVEKNSLVPAIRDHVWSDQAGVSVALGWEIVDKSLSASGMSRARPVHYSKYLQRTGWLSPEWNPQGFAKTTETARVIHFAGERNEVRQPKMEVILQKLKSDGILT